MSNWLTRAFDAGIAELGRGITDARQRVIEEGTYGKVVTPRVSSVTIQSPGGKSPGDDLGWTLPGTTRERGGASGWFREHFAPSDNSRDAGRGERAERDIHGNEHSRER